MSVAWIAAGGGGLVASALLNKERTVIKTREQEPVSLDVLASMVKTLMEDRANIPMKADMVNDCMTPITLQGLYDDVQVMGANMWARIRALEAERDKLANRLECVENSVIEICVPAQTYQDVPATKVPLYTISQVGHIAAGPQEQGFVCDGSAVSRSMFPTLFAMIGTTYGAGDGVTTFNLPDLRGIGLKL